MHLLRLLWTALRDAAWAPLLVIIFRVIAMKLGIRAQLDHVIHFSGGFAIAYFLYRVAGMAQPFIGKLLPLTRNYLAFTSACTVAVFWEIGEFASDVTIGTHIQHSVSETLWDLIYGVTGAMACVALITLIETFRLKKAEQATVLTP